MAYQNSTLSLEQMLLKFMSEQDPVLSMLQWLCEQMMETEVTAKIQAQKSERTDTRTGYRSGYRIRRFDTRMGTMYLFVPNCAKAVMCPFLSRQNPVRKQPDPGHPGSLYPGRIHSKNQETGQPSGD